MTLKKELDARLAQQTGTRGVLAPVTVGHLFQVDGARLPGRRRRRYLKDVQSPVRTVLADREENS